MNTVTANYGDTIDSLCFRHYQSTDMVEAVLEVNPHIAEKLILDGGEQVKLPARQTSKKQLMNLWN